MVRIEKIIYKCLHTFSFCFSSTIHKPGLFLIGDDFFKNAVTKGKLTMSCIFAEMRKNSRVTARISKYLFPYIDEELGGTKRDPVVKDLI